MSKFALTTMYVPPWTYGVALPCLASCLAGTLGGIVNHVLAERRRSATTERGASVPVSRPIGWQHDIRGDVVIGLVIGFVTYLGGMNDVPVPKILLAAVIGGVSGATYFTKTQEVKEARRQARRDRAKSQTFKKATELALEPSVKEEGNGTESADL